MTALDPERAFLGMGWAYPARLDNGHLARVAYDEDIRQAILIILGTNPGERVMRPDFGAGLNAFVFEPASTTTLSLIRTRVFNALTDWEPRIDLERVRVSFDPDLGRTPRPRNDPEPRPVRHDPPLASKVCIEILYKVRLTNTQFNLVYPFYLEEGTPA